MRSPLAMTIMMAMLAGCAPANRARSSCESHPLTTADEWTCTVQGPVVDSAVAITYDTESRNQIGRVNVALQVTKGTLRLTYYDLSGEKHLLVTPSAPANLAMQTRMHKENRSFTLLYEPVDGAVEGLAGTVKYSTP